MNRSITICMLALLLTGCGGTTVSNSNANKTTKPAPVKSPAADTANGNADLSTPKATVQAFIKAAEQSDIDVLSQCLDPNSGPKFKGLRDKSATPDDLSQLADQVGGGQVVDVTEKGDNASVKVKVNDGVTVFTLKRSGASWKILSF